MIRKILMLLAFLFSENCAAIDVNDTSDLTGMSVMSLLERKPRSNYVSFEPLGEHIQLGLDFLLPFLRVPLVSKVDANGHEPALVNINTAALVTTGLLASSSALVSLIFRKYMLPASVEPSLETRRRSENVLGNELWSVFNNFKLVYTNSSGIRVDTSVASLFDTINESFKKNDVDLSSCIQKTICARLQISARRVNEGNASGIDKIVDGLMGIKWLKEFLQHTSLEAAIQARDNLSLLNQQRNKQQFCDVKYSQCKWSSPEDYLANITKAYLKFT